MENMTTKELYTVAKTLNIAGRSKMNKAELLKAIEAHKAAMKDASNDYEKAQAFKDFQFLTRPGSSAERAIVKRIDGKQRYFILHEMSFYNRDNNNTSYYVEVTEREFYKPVGEFVYPFTDIKTHQPEVKSHLVKEILDFISESKDDGETYMTFDFELTADEVAQVPVVHSSHTDDLIYEDQYKQVWSSRMTKEDGAEHDNAITVNYKDQTTYKWIEVQEYQPN